VRVIIPLGAGGGGDIFTRALTDELQKRLGQSFVVENRTGGALNIGTRACAESAPDGYTICVISSEPIVYNQFLFKSLPFNPEKDFEPITNLFFNTLAFAVNPDLKVKAIPELMALAKTKQLSYSTFSFPLAHFMEKLKQKHGVDIVRVPYRSGNEVMTALLSGATPITLLGLANMVPQLRSGHVAALAVNANTRSPLFPAIPTIKEATGDVLPQSWFGLFAPAGTPKPIINKLATEVAAITADPAFHKKTYIDRAVERAVDTPENSAKFIKEDRALAARIVKESGVQPQ
jgi:tripartite-type tricarboxylate transporter receptor subunit TctC